MTLVLLDTNAYLRLAKRIKPLLGKPFGQKSYVLTILRDVEDEVRRSSRLRHNYPWFEAVDLNEERMAQSVRLTVDEKATLAATASVLHGIVQMDVDLFTSKGRSPPSLTDWCSISPAIVQPTALAAPRAAAPATIERVSASCNRRSGRTAPREPCVSMRGRVRGVVATPGRSVIPVSRLVRVRAGMSQLLLVSNVDALSHRSRICHTAVSSSPLSPHSPPSPAATSLRPASLRQKVSLSSSTRHPV